MKVMDIYNCLPVFMQNVAVSLEGYRIQKRRYDALFEMQYKEYMERNDWSYREKCEYRDKKIKQMVEHCYNTVPYYRNIMRKNNLIPDDFQTLDDLQKLPIIDKQTVKEHFEEFFSTDFDKEKLIQLHTSGSTGAGFVFFEDKVADSAVWAHVWRGNYNIGLNRNMWCAYFGGKAIVPLKCDKSPFYRINYPGKQIMFSIYHLKPDNIKHYISVLNKYRPPWIQGYPSALSVIADYILRTGMQLQYRPKVVTVSSESISKSQICAIEKAFGVYPIQNYAQSEAVATFRQRKDKKIFIDEDFSAVEFIPEQGEVYKIVGTTLTNYAMPFLRYDTKDLAVWKETPEGREIISLEGRMEDAVSLPDGRRIRRLSRMFQEQIHIVEAQIFQKKDYSLIIRIVKDKDYSVEHEKKLKDDIDRYLMGNIDYILEYMDSIPRSKNGKMKFIISEI